MKCIYVNKGDNNWQVLVPRAKNPGKYGEYTTEFSKLDFPLRLFILQQQKAGKTIDAIKESSCWKYKLGSIR